MSKRRTLRPRLGPAEMAEVREALTRHRGGWEGATDEQILEAWDALDSKVQHAYLSAVRGQQQLEAEPADQQETDRVD